MSTGRGSRNIPLTFVEGFHKSGELLQNVQYNSLGRTGLEVSSLSLGGSAFGSQIAVTEAECIAVVQKAFKSGINYVDTAPFYGLTKAETILGKALETVPRNAYYIATKVGRYGHKDFDFSAEKTLKSVDESLARLGCGSIDVIQVHDLEFAPNLDIIINETLPALQRAKELGKIQFIGITGYPIMELRHVLERSRTQIDTVLSYSRCCLHDTALLDHVPFFEEKGIGLIDAAGMGMGLYTTSAPPDWHPAGAEIKEACKKAAVYCQERKADISKLALHFNLMQKGPATHLIGCGQIDVLEDNLSTWMNGINSSEETILQEIREKFFNPPMVRNWEGIELSKYRMKYTSQVPVKANLNP